MLLLPSISSIPFPMTRKYVDPALIAARNAKGVASALRRKQWLDVPSLSHEDILWLLSEAKSISVPLRERLAIRRDKLGKRIVSTAITTPGITELLVKHASPQQRAQFLTLCRETSTATIKARHQTPQPIATLTELERIVASGMWRAILDSPTLPAGASRYYPDLHDALLRLESEQNLDLEMASFRLYDRRHGPMFWKDTSELRDRLQHMQRPMSLSVHARQGIVTGLQTEWAWRFRCEEVQAHVAATLGWNYIIRHGQIWQSDILNPNITESVVLHLAVYPIVSRHEKFLLTVSKRDWPNALRRYLDKRPPSVKCIGYVFRHSAHRCIAAITSTEEDVLRVMKIIVENENACGEAGLRYLRDLLSQAPR